MLLRVLVLVCGLWLAFAQASVTAHDAEHPFHAAKQLCDQLIHADSIKLFPSLEGFTGRHLLQQAERQPASRPASLPDRLANPSARDPPSFS